MEKQAIRLTEAKKGVVCYPDIRNGIPGIVYAEPPPGYVAPQPVYVEPRPVYAPRPVVVAPAPVYAPYWRRTR
ncbi:hypothetical protein [Cupriavidus sp. BIC8F]|uniref:hypothetical protein n=1 Tax=Cupriavidus sp. BIC8F TaxID=3079014 RepID=UPI003967B0CA